MEGSARSKPTAGTDPSVSFGDLLNGVAIFCAYIDLVSTDKV